MKSDREDNQAGGWPPILDRLETYLADQETFWTRQAEEARKASGLVDWTRAHADANAVALAELRRIKAESRRLSSAPPIFLCQVCDQTPERGHAPDCPGAHEPIATLSEWQPIDTAPTDGTKILARSYRRVVIAHYSGGYWLLDSSESMHEALTHWIAIPPIQAAPTPTDTPDQKGAGLFRACYPTASESVRSFMRKIAPYMFDASGALKHGPECPTCQGRGYLKLPWPADCPTCGGSGVEVRS